ncbi:MAG: UDP-2,4-diacetamido-2,4,6-trideoxy-beta-L-altropyranose hydrolase [Candidatus Anammoxibacter sp.]
MNIVFRTNASISIGSGHVMRCLTLADILNQKGCEISFICRELPGNLCDYVEKKGYQVHILPEIEPENDLSGQTTAHADWLGVDWKTDALQTADVLGAEQKADWMIVDHYALDERWEKYIRPHVKKIMVIDDLADRKHDCDLLLDQNLYEDMETRYDELMPQDCVKLLGPKYALLRREFVEARKNLKMRNGTVKRILIFFGGSDPTNETSKALEAVRLLNRPDIAVDVVVGSANPHKDAVKELCSKLPNTYYHYQVENMADLMVKADLAAGAGGSITWEKCCLGLPSIVYSIAKNQEELAKGVGKYGALFYFGCSSSVNAEKISCHLSPLLSSPDNLKAVSKKGMFLVDGIGCDRVVKKMWSS